MQAFSVFIGFISSLPTTCTTKLEFANPRHSLCVSVTAGCHKTADSTSPQQMKNSVVWIWQWRYHITAFPDILSWAKDLLVFSGTNMLLHLLFSSNDQQCRAWALTHHLPTKSLFIDLIQLLCLFKHCLIVFLCVLPDHFVIVNFSLYTVSVTSSQVWGALCFSWVLKGPIIIDHPFINNHWLLLHDMCDFCSYYKYHKCSTEPTH